jgi:pyruvate/2-oxoglutarate dehydrogenase complex dihydrolipoamide acyltransferase (E2) component
MRQHRTATGEALSFTAFIVSCLAKAVDEDKAVQGYRAGRGRIVLFEDVDVNTMVERQVDGQLMGTPNIIRAANRKTLRQIHEHIRAAQAGAVEQAPGMEWFRWVTLFAALPTSLRMVVWRAAFANPRLVKRAAGTVGVTAVGMFGKGMRWGFTIPLLTLNLVVGGIEQRPALVKGEMENREYLHMTLSVDHDIVDGAPAARFAGRLNSLIEEGFGLPVDR